MPTARRSGGGASPDHWVHRAPEPAGSRAGRVLNAFRELWRTHPRWDLRRNALTDPSALFELPALPMFLTGAAGVLINAQLSSALARYGLLGGWWSSGAGVLSAGLVTAVMGFALWRATVYAAVTARPAPSGLSAGLWLGSGMAAGELATNRASLYEWLPARPQVFGLAVLAGAVFACWIAQCAHLWLRVWRGRTIRPPMILTLVAAGLVLTVWFSWWSNEIPELSLGSPFSQAGQLQIIERAYQIPPGQHPAMLSVIAAVYPMVLAVSDAPLATSAVAALWLVPLLTFLVRPVVGPPSWAGGVVRDFDRSPQPSLPAPPWSRVLLAGLLGGILCCAAVVIVRALLHARPPSPPPSGLYVITYVSWLFVALIIGTAIAAGAASVLARQFRLLMALIASQIAAIVGLTGIFLVSSLESCVPPVNAHQATCHWLPAPAWGFTQPFLAPGLVVSALVAIVVAAMARGCAAGISAVFWLFRPAFRSPCGPGPGSSGRPRHDGGARCLPVVVLGIAAVTITAVTTLTQARAHQVEPTTRDWAGLLRIAEAPSSPRVQAMQVGAWTRTGGQELLIRFAGDLDEIGKALDEAPNGVLTEQRVASRVRLACVDIRRLTGEAKSFFRVPDAQAQHIWQILTEQADKGGTDCVHAIDQHNDALFDTALTEIAAAGTTANSLGQRLHAVIMEGIAEREPRTSGG